MKAHLVVLLTISICAVRATDDDFVKVEEVEPHELRESNKNIEVKSVEDIPGLSEEMLTDAINEAKREILEEEKTRKPKVLQDVDQSMQAKHYRRGQSPALEPVRIDAMVKERTIKKIAHKLDMSSEDAVKILDGLESNSLNAICRSIPQTAPCIKVPDGFRSIDGKGNNLFHSNLGQANSPFQRIIKPQYGDGISSPRKAANGGELPNARRVSRTVFKDKNLPSHKFSHMAMIWGQFLDHDITLAAQPDIDCSKSCGLSGECFGIRIMPRDRPFRGRSCIALKRDVPFCATQRIRREQMNTITAFIDASNVYSSDQNGFQSLRDPKDSSLLLEMRNPHPYLKKLLPKQDAGQFCSSPDRTSRPCFKAGDERVNENSGLASMHTIWTREHNRIVSIFKIHNDHWSKDRMFFEARKIVGAMMQHITYNEFLPAILDKNVRRKFRLVLRRKGFFRGYRRFIDPSIINSFAAAAYRFGHSMVRNQMSRFGKSYRRTTSIPMNRFNDPSFLYQSRRGGVDSILRGLACDRSQTIDSFFAKAVQEQLVRMAGDLADLPALNIQRGREHGLPGYNSFRRFAGLRKARWFSDLQDVMTYSQIRQLKSVYKNVDDIDLFVGGMFEKRHGTGSVGKTFSVIIADQFRRLRLGDRFWYENPGQFTQRQLQEIRKASLARVICDNSDAIHQIYGRVLQRKYFKSCRSVKTMDLSQWKTLY